MSLYPPADWFHQQIFNIRAFIPRRFKLFFIGHFFHPNTLVFLLNVQLSNFPFCYRDFPQFMMQITDKYKAKTVNRFFFKLYNVHFRMSGLSWGDLTYTIEEG